MDDDWDAFDDLSDADDLDDWDHAGTGLGDDHLDGWEDDDLHDVPEVDDLGGGAVWEPRPTSARPTPRAMVSAWDVGAGAAIAGWLLDRQADRIAEGVRQVVADDGDRVHTVADPARARPASIARPAVPSPATEPIDWTAAPVQPGGVLTRSALATRIALHLGSGHQLPVDARARATSGSPADLPGADWSALTFSVAVIDLVPELPLWVMVDLRPRGFTGERLAEVFTDPGPPGRAYRFVAKPAEAVDAITWALGRHGLRLDDFTWVPEPDRSR